MPGILHARAASAVFRYEQRSPADALRPFVEHYWIVAWDRRGLDPYEQWVLPYPAVNMTFKRGRCRVVGVPRGRFSEVLDDAHRVIGVRFRPGGFRGFLQAPVSTITNRMLGVEAVFGDGGHELAQAVPALNDQAAVDRLERFLLDRLPAPDPMLELVTRVVQRIETDPGLLRAAELATACGLGVRALQRLFAEYVGVGPKWTIRRYRLHDAAARLAAGADVDPVLVAADLGYSDQAHFTRDFAAIAGVPPARYARAQ